ncbi:hypothetical protein ZWY2020_045912 [Hordeum vulgare]|nr:hypothetical protein ZWY2020_045912 [Hordeum vulgare]
MAGRAPKQPPPALTSRTGQGSRATAPVPVQVGRTPGSSVQPGKQQGVVGQQGTAGNEDTNRMQPRGRWGDDGFNAYGIGHHRGLSSAGGGRGHSWPNNGGNGNGFTAPPGKFVPGSSGPTHPRRGGFRHNWGGRGGGRKPRPPVHVPDPPAEVEVPTVVAVKDSVKEGVDPVLPDQNLDVTKGEGGRLRNDGPVQPGLPKFPGKNPQTKVDLTVGQSNNSLQPVSLGEFLAGARTASCQPAAVAVPAVLPQVVHDALGLEGEVETVLPVSDSAGPVCQPSLHAVVGQVGMQLPAPDVVCLPSHGGTTQVSSEPLGAEDDMLTAAIEAVHLF